MFNIGMGELILIMGVALVFLGPEKFPVFAKVLMHAYRDFRQYKDEIMREVTKELAPIRKDLQELSRYKPEDYIESLALAVSTEPKDEEAKEREEKGSEEVKPEAEVVTEHAAEPPEAATPEPDASAATSAPEGTRPRDEYPYSD